MQQDYLYILEFVETKAILKIGHKKENNTYFDLYLVWRMQLMIIKG